MSTQTLIVRILIAAAVVTVIVVAVAVAYSYLSIGLFLSWVLFFVVAGVIVLYNSVYILEPGHMIAFYLIATWVKTVVTKTYYDENEGKIVNAEDGDRVVTGLFGFDVAFGLWPFYRGFRLPTTTFEIPISATSMYTRAGQPGKETLPRIRLSGDGTLQIGLHPVIKRLGPVLPILYQRVTNLAEIVILKDAPLGPDGEVLEGPEIANLINGVVKKPMLQAMRTAAAQFTWGTEDGEDDTDIVNCRDEYELAIQRVLLELGSVFLKAGFLLDPDKDPDGGPGIRSDKNRWRLYVPKTGPTLMEFDVVVELIKPEPTSENASELEKAIDLAYIGMQEGAREQAKERMRLLGQAEGYKEMADKLGITEEKIQLVLLEAIRQGKIEVTAIGGSGAEGLLGLLDGLIRKAKP